MSHGGCWIICWNLLILNRHVCPLFQQYFLFWTKWIFNIVIRLNFPWHNRFKPVCPLYLSYSYPSSTRKFTALKWPFSHFLYRYRLQKRVFKNIWKLSPAKSWHQRVALNVSFQKKSTFKAYVKYLVPGTCWKFCEPCPTPKNVAFPSGQLLSFCCQKCTISLFVHRKCPKDHL